MAGFGSTGSSGRVRLPAPGRVAFSSELGLSRIRRFRGAAEEKDEGTAHCQAEPEVDQADGGDLDQWRLPSGGPERPDQERGHPVADHDRTQVEQVEPSGPGWVVHELVLRAVR